VNKQSYLQFIDFNSRALPDSGLVLILWVALPGENQTLQISSVQSVDRAEAIGIQHKPNLPL
jgi:hypothetical protein